MSSDNNNQALLWQPQFLPAGQPQFAPSTAGLLINSSPTPLIPVNVQAPIDMVGAAIQNAPYNMTPPLNPYATGSGVQGTGVGPHRRLLPVRNQVLGRSELLQRSTPPKPAPPGGTSRAVVSRPTPPALPSGGNNRAVVHHHTPPATGRSGENMSAVIPRSDFPVPGRGRTAPPRGGSPSIEVELSKTAVLRRMQYQDLPLRDKAWRYTRKQLSKPGLISERIRKQGWEVPVTASTNRHPLSDAAVDELMEKYVGPVLAGMTSPDDRKKYNDAIRDMACLAYRRYGLNAIERGKEMRRQAERDRQRAKRDTAPLQIMKERRESPERAPQSVQRGSGRHTAGSPRRLDHRTGRSGLQPQDPRQPDPKKSQASSGPVTGPSANPKAPSGLAGRAAKHGKHAGAVDVTSHGDEEINVHMV
ncbi:hypothetical protein PG985_016050 [Apiospora marii]|uniref:uncharacterized protein n=1 Tax=Apiospora marii TaxID=335849 RepID=UPI0031324592